jgi:hypothetical protein
MEPMTKKEIAEKYKVCAATVNLKLACVVPVAVRLTPNKRGRPAFVFDADDVAEAFAPKE